MSWPTAIEWVGLIGTLATITSLVLAWGARDTKRILDRMDTANRLHHAQTQGMLDRMDRAADQRQTELKALLERGRR